MNPVEQDETVGQVKPGLYRVLVRLRGARRWKKAGRAHVRESGRVDFRPAIRIARRTVDGPLEFALSRLLTKRQKLRAATADRRVRRASSRAQAGRPAPRVAPPSAPTPPRGGRVVGTARRVLGALLATAMEIGPKKKGQA